MFDFEAIITSKENETIEHHSKHSIFVLRICIFCFDLRRTSESQNDRFYCKKMTSNTNQALTEKEKLIFLQSLWKKVPTTFYPHEMFLTLDHLTTITIVVDINPYTQTVRFSKDTLIPFYKITYYKSH